MTASNYIRWFKSLGIGDIALVGGKTASLGEMFGALTPKGIRIPNGFAITTDAYRDALRVSDHSAQLFRLIESFHSDNMRDLSTRAASARHIVYRAMESPEQIGRASCR